MKMTFRPSINSKKKEKKFILSGALVALILIVIIFPNFSFRLVNHPAMFIINPFFRTGNRISGWWNNVKVVFAEKKALKEDNNFLREKIMQVEIKIAFSEILEKENEMLKSSIQEKNKFLIAYIISRPPLTPYDMIIIDSGFKNGAKEGMQVSAFGNALLGYVADVFPDTSKIKLISSFGEETNVIMESSQTPAIAIGRGGENSEIILPRAVNVNVGERIITLGKEPLLVGIVEKIENPATAPFQKLLFRLPVNIQYLNQVFLLKK